MATAHVKPGICGLKTTIYAKTNEDELIEITVDSQCPMVTRGAAKLEPIDPYVEIFQKPAGTSIYQTMAPELAHTACPVYTAMFKAVEVEGGLALPAPVEVILEK